MSTGINDIVLANIDGKPAFFARIEEILPDVKPGWWRVRLLVLTVPLQVYHWILQEEQINGLPFTMGGTPVVLEKVVAPESEQAEPPPEPARQEQKPAEPAKVVSLFGKGRKQDP